MAKDKKNKKGSRRPSKRESQNLARLADFVTKTVKDSAHVVPNVPPASTPPLTLDAAVKGTFLEKVAEVLASGKFIEPEGEIAPDETVIGEMTPFEKAVYTAINLVVQEANQKLPPCDCGVACVDACTCQSPMSPDMKQELVTANMIVGALEQTLGALIQERLRCYSEKIDGFSYRQGFKIVTMPPQPEMMFFGGNGMPGAAPPKIGNA